MENKNKNSSEDFSTEKSFEEALDEMTGENASKAADENTSDQAMDEAETSAETGEALDEEASAEESDDSQSDDEKEKAEKASKKDKKDEMIEALQDQAKRQMAEFVNFRNRTEKEKAQMYDMGARAVIEKFLPVVDNFERGLSGVNEGDDAFSDGMLMIYRQLMTQLKEIGVEPIEAVGKEFNADLHNAVMQTASEEYESGIVAQELQKGYTYKEQVVRHSMVSVAE